jgi:DNA-binding transcriptional regulator GbsR (MarR family)
MDQARHRLVEAAGQVTQLLGSGRVVGQIYAWIYLNPEPQSLGDLTQSLGISKGSASIGVRTLEQWGALQKVWVKGDRRDYYRVRDEFGAILRKAFSELVGQRLASMAALVREAESAVPEDAGMTREDAAFVRERIERLRAFQSKAEHMWVDVISTIVVR